MVKIPSPFYYGPTPLMESFILDPINNEECTQRHNRESMPAASILGLAPAICTPRGRLYTLLVQHNA